MLSVYPACFFKDDEGYTVVFPDLNWLATQGKDINEAMAMAVDCLAGYLHSCEQDGEDIPEASEMFSISLQGVAAELEISAVGAFLNMVSVDVEEYAKIHFCKSVRKSLTIPEWLNEEAIKRNINFSRTLQDALLQKVQSK